MGLEGQGFLCGAQGLHVHTPQTHLQRMHRHALVASNHACSHTYLCCLPASLRALRQCNKFQELRDFEGRRRYVMDGWGGC